jgi:hypothetical protein
MSDKMKAIFLDHDGVICLSNEFGSRHTKRKKANLSNIIPLGYQKTIIDFDNFNKKAVKVLNEIIQKTGAKIIVSSDWRIGTSIELLSEIYLSQGIITSPIDKTMVIDSSSEQLEASRIFEIKTYLSDHPEIENYVVIDDLEMFEFGEHFVHCPRITEGIKQTGLKEKIIKILNK